MKKIIINLFLICVVLFLNACASMGSYTVDNQNYPINDIRKIVGNAIGGTRNESENGRTLVSRFYSRNRRDDFEADLSNKLERLYTRVEILGDRRPYDLRVTVVIEHKENGTFVQVGKEKHLAQKIGEEIREKLISLEKRNVIDDFRVF